ncbi:hypothetical protein PISMIDRAFT_19974 [Pisolithus microcarpus 441]|uniref:Uncharacterized protein n=1 Tax=Pisolithus microcarpus 441 TaxID=765257 RepID=A0A0C9YSG1_9AGAM|nr:hypothetical protein PISMIDRAFT_19974 [Pisolithus microcarpus 441]
MVLGIDSIDSANILGGGILACASSISSVSIHWDEAGMRTIKKKHRKEKESKMVAKEKDKKRERSKNEKVLTRKVSDSRKRKPLVAIFPGTLSERKEEDVTPSPVLPIVIMRRP